MIPETMRAIEIAVTGGPEGLAPTERPTPTPAPGEALIKVHAAGVNGPDILQRRGAYPPPPGASDLPGLEVSGEVVAAAGDLSVGDQVCALTKGGGYAEYVAVDARHCLPIPPGVSLIDAAGLPETYFTVWNNFFHPAPPVAGTRFLVQGGSGGIGSTAVQLGAAFGCRVFATAGTPEGRDFCLALGAERAIDYREEDFVTVMKEVGGADLVLDMRGGDYIARHIKAAAPDARIVQLAFNAGAEVTVNLAPLMVKRLTLTGSTLRPRSDAFKAAIADGLREQVWPRFGTDFRAVTHATFPLTEAVAAHRMMEAGGHQGKIILTM